MHSLEEVRRARRWSQTDLAHHAGLTQATVSRIETGVVRGYRRTHVKIAAAFGLPVDELFPN